MPDSYICKSQISKPFLLILSVCGKEYFLSSFLLLGYRDVLEKKVIPCNNSDLLYSVLKPMPELAQRKRWRRRARAVCEQFAQRGSVVS